MKNRTFLKGAIILIIFNLIGKAIGAVYRIPLARIIGSVGMGQYQLAFPLYCLILTVSTSGIPVAISKLVAEYNAKEQFKDSKRLLSISIIILFILSLAGSALMFFGAKMFAMFQGNSSAYITYYGIAPAVLFVGLMSALRGYFQGNLMMTPTAVSGLIEQVAKLAIGLFLAIKLIDYGVMYAVFGALLGISISEFLALLFLGICYIVHKFKNRAKTSSQIQTNREITKQLFSLALPITLGGLISPLATMIDSFVAVNVLMSINYTSEVATMMLGLESGVVEPLINLPVVIALSISTVLLPSLSSMNAEKNKQKIKQLIEKAYQITLSLSAVSAVCFVIFGRQIISLLYGGSFSDAEILLAVKLLFISSSNIIFLSLFHLSTSILQALGHAKFAVKTLLIGSLLKVLLNVTLIRIPEVNIMGAVIASVACYALVFALNQRKVKLLTDASAKNTIFYTSIQAGAVCVFAFFSNHFLSVFLSPTISLIVAGIISLIIFFATYYAFFINGKNSKNATELTNNSVE